MTTRAAASPGGSDGTSSTLRRYSAVLDEATQEDVMGRGILLWLIGIPLPIILLIWLFGGLHS
ncbi:MAG: hypothetical protein WB764_03400 [Xanthobacteraceae bacterium]